MLSILRRALLVAVASASVTASSASAAATLHVSAASSDAAACTAAAPCRTLARAYELARPGSEVILQSGDYGDQLLANLPSKSAAGKVVFRSAPGARVRLGTLRIENTANVEVRDVRATGWRVSNAAHVVLRNVRVTDISDTGGYLSGAHDVRIVGGEIGRADPEDAIHMNASDGHNTNIVFDGLFVHDLTRNRNRSSHIDCVQAADVTNLRIVNSRFVNCGTQGVFLNTYGGGVTRNVTIENSWFGPAQLGYNALYVGNAVNVLVQNNSFTHGVHIESRASRTSMIGNILNGDGHSCSANAGNAVVFAYNLTKESCSGASHNRVDPGLASDFVHPSAANAATFDLNIKKGARAIDAADPARYPAADYHGHARPAGRGPDIGAVEYGAGGAPPTRSRPGGGPPPRRRAAARVRSLRMKKWRDCRSGRRHCRTLGARVRVAVSRATKLRVKLRRVKGKHSRRSWHRAMRIRHGGVTVFKMRVRKLRHGRYVLTARPHGGRKVKERGRL